MSTRKIKIKKKGSPYWVTDLTDAVQIPNGTENGNKKKKEKGKEKEKE
ncbi:MAG: hypothetical protein Q8877_03240 [Sweet potato little leaf phytoplasma]|nr:hypothetical protein [Sweet potato little leaf phytoplasma]